MSPMTLYAPSGCVAVEDAARPVALHGETFLALGYCEDDHSTHSDPAVRGITADIARPVVRASFVTRWDTIQIFRTEVVGPPFESDLST